MRRLARRSLVGTLGATVLLVVHLAVADAAMMIEFVGTVVTIVDNGEGDSSDAPGIIKFDESPAGTGYRARGTLQQDSSPATSTFSITLTNMIVSQVGTVGTPGFTDARIHFTSSVVNPFFPTTVFGGHLDGEYIKVDAAGEPVSGGTMTQADVLLGVWGGVAGGAEFFGFVDPPPAIGVSAPVSFNDSLVSDERTFHRNIELRGELFVRLGTGDGIILPTSASVSASLGAVPEPSTLLLLSLGLAGLAASRARRQFFRA